MKNFYFSHFKLCHLFIGISLMMTMLIFPFDLLYSQCSCDNNLVTNGGFNSNVNNWSSYNGDFIKNNAYPQCGTTGHAQLYKTSGTWAGFY